MGPAPWITDRIRDFQQLSTDQKLSLIGVILTAIAAIATVLATWYSRGAVREGRRALQLARATAREERATRRLAQLQSLLEPLHDLQTAAAVAAPDPTVGAEALRDARKVLSSLLQPFEREEIPEAFDATDPTRGASDVLASAAEGVAKVGRLLQTTREEMASAAADVNRAQK